MLASYPFSLLKAPRPDANSFAILFTLECFSRAILATVLPLHALRLLETPSTVSLVYFLAGIFGIISGLFIPSLSRRIPRRYLYCIGATLLLIAPLSMMMDSTLTQVIGMLLRVTGVVAITICLNLYMLQYITKKEMNRSEPKRIFYSAFAWTLAPGLGTWLFVTYGPAAAYSLGALSAASCLVFFWCLQLSDPKSVQVATQPPHYPLHSIGRFLKQPRLVTAWLIAVGRSAWWATIFVYTPIFAVESGLGEMAGGFIVSIALGFIFLTPAWGKYLRIFGLRKVLVVGFALAGVAAIAMALTMGTAYVAAALILLGCLMVSSMDAIGNMSFMLSVRTRERTAMTSIYSSYRDVGELVPPGIFSVTLRYFDLSAVFLITGLSMLCMSRLGALVHPRLGRERAYDPKFR